MGAAMKRHMLVVGWLALLGAVSAHAQIKIPGPVAATNGAATSKEASALIGTWRLVEFSDLDDDGKWVYRFGEHAKGYFVYDDTGHVHIQIMKVPPVPRFPEANTSDDKPPTAEHALAAYNAYVAYFGTYTVDTEKHIVTHHVEGSLSPDYTDTDQPRPFKLSGNRLEIGDGKTWRRVLERVR